MDIFSVGLITAFALTGVFFTVLFSFIFYWHLVKITYWVVPLIWTFDYFIMCCFVVVIVTLIFKYLPVLVQASGI